MAVSSSFVPVDQVVATAMSLVEVADTIDRAYMKEWVYLGLNDIGPNVSWFKEASLIPTGLQMRKPTDLYSTVDITLYDANNCELKATYRGLGTRSHFSDNSLINQGVYAPALGAPVDLSEDAYYFNLGSNGTAVAQAKIKYMAHPVDEDGNLMIPENLVLPLSYFVVYMYSIRKSNLQGQQVNNQKWIAARNEARGANNTPTMLVGTELARSWNSMIQKQRFKLF